MTAIRALVISIPKGSSQSLGSEYNANYYSFNSPCVLRVFVVCVYVYVCMCVSWVIGLGCLAVGGWHRVDWPRVIGLGSSCWWSCEVEVGAAIPRPREKANNMLVPGDVIIISWTYTYEKSNTLGFLKGANTGTYRRD